MSSFNLKHVWNPSLLNDLSPDTITPPPTPQKTIDEIIQEIVQRMQQEDEEHLFLTEPSLLFKNNDLLHSIPSQTLSSSEDSASLPIKEEGEGMVQESSILSRIQSLLRVSPRQRRSSQRAPATAAILDTRQLMSGTPATVALDTANWGTPTNGAQASAQSLPGKTTYDLGLSPDGSTFATANGDGSIHIFNAATGVDMQTLSGHTALLTGVEYNPSGTLIASTGYDKTVKIWDAATGALQKSIAIANLGTDLLWSPDGTSIAVGVVEHSVTLINAQTGAIVRTFPIGGEACRFSFVKGGSAIAIGHGTTMKLFETSTGIEQLSLAGLPGQIYATGTNANGSLVAAGDAYGQVAVWDAATGAKLWQQSGHGPARSIAFAPDGRHIIVAGHTGKITVYDATQLTTGQMTVVQEYTTPAFPQSIIVSPSSQTFMLTTSDNTTTSRTMVFDLPDPPDVPALPQTPTGPNSNAVDAIAEALEREQQKIYPRMLITPTSTWNGSEGHTNFSVRLSNPGDKSFIQVAGVAANGNNHRINETIYHPGGTADTQWNFDLQCRYGNVLTGAFTVTLYTDETRTTVLECTTCTFNNEQNSGSVVSEQYPWEHIQQGLLEEHPIVSDMKIVKIDGPTLLLSVASPYDKSIVTSVSGGILSTQELTHEGGTAFNLSRITFNAGVPTGDYPIQLCDRTNGKVTDTIMVHWDSSTKKLTSVDSADMMSAERASQTDTAAFDAIMSLTTANLDGGQLNWIQQIRSYEMTKDLDAEHNFYITNIEAMILVIRPEYREENWTKAIEALMGPKDIYGRTRTTAKAAKDFFHRNRLDFIRLMRDALGAYEANMGKIMQKAIDIYIQVSHGADERVQVEQLDKLIAECKKDKKLAPLSQLRISIPSRGKIMEAAGLVYAKSFMEMIGRQKDVVKFREASDRMRELGLRQTAEGEWMEVSEDTNTEVPPEISRRELSLAAKIRSTLASSNDPRIVAYTTTIKNALALQIAQAMPEDATAEEIAQITTVAMEAADMGDVGGYRINLEDPAYISAKEFIEQSTQQELFNIAQNISSFYTDFGIPPSTDALRADLPIVKSTIAGKLFSECAEALFDAPNKETAMTIAFILEAVSDIPAAKWMNAKEYSTPRVFARVIKGILDAHQFSDVFLQKNLTQTPTITGVHLNLPEGTNTYTDTNVVRVRLDAMTQGAAIIGIAAYSGGGLLAQSSGSLFINVPMNRSGDGLTITLHVTLADGRTMDIQTQEFNMRLTQIGQHLSVSNDPIENAILDQMANMETFVVRGQGWRRTISSDYHLGDGLFAMDLNKGAGADDDNEAVYSPAEGYVDSITFEPTNGKSTLVIKHTTVINGQPVEWYTKYLHMDKMGTFDTNGSVTSPFIVGQYIAAVQHIGEVGAVGADGQVHLHVEILHSDKTLIDGRKLIEHNGMLTKAWDGKSGGELFVEWDPTLQAWKGNEAKNAGLVFAMDANQYTGGDTNVWVAWDSDPAMRGVVRWVLNKNTNSSMWMKVDTLGNPILTNNMANHWTGTGWEFISI